jgi:type II secretory pathway component GspD/PulD (secretin)
VAAGVHGAVLAEDARNSTAMVLRIRPKVVASSAAPERVELKRGPCGNGRVCP